MNEQKPVFNRRKNILITLSSFVVCFLPAYILCKYLLDNGPIGAPVAIAPIIIVAMILFFLLISLFDKIFK